MKKEQFIYELIDSYLYYVNLSNIVMENYTCKERTSKSLEIAIDELKKCLVFYDKLYQAVKEGKVDEKVANVKLEYIITCLSSKEKRTMINEINRYSVAYIDDIDDFLRKNLLYDKKGREQVISQKTIEQYVLAIRQREESVVKGIL